MGCCRRLTLFRNINSQSSSTRSKSGNKPKWYSFFNDIRRSLGIGGTPIEVEVAVELDVVPCVQETETLNRKRLK